MKTLCLTDYLIQIDLRKKSLNLVLDEASLVNKGTRRTKNKLALLKMCKERS